MPDPDAQADDGVDFVVGGGVGVGRGGGVAANTDPGPGTRADAAPRWRQDLRFRLTLAGAAVILALGTLVARASSQHDTAAPPSSPPSSSAAPSSAAPSSPQTILNPFQLATRANSNGDCPFATTCSSAPTSGQAFAAVRAVFTGSDILSANTWLGVRNGRFGPDLLARTITARLPVGTLTVTVRKPTNGETPTVRRSVDPKVTVVTVGASVNGYAVTAQLAQRTGRIDPSSLLTKLANDPRLLAIR